MQAVFLNLGPPSKVSIKEANSDIMAILDTEPDLFVGCESTGKGVLPNRDGYVKIRDRSSGGRANIYAYVKDDGILTFRWEDMKVKFKKEPGRKGLHDPRSFVHFTWKKIWWGVGHHPPEWPGTDAARAEHLIEVRHAFAPWKNEEHWAKVNQSGRERSLNKARAFFWDRNMNLPEFRAFAKTCDAWTAGEAVDSLMYRHLHIGSQGYQKVFGGHRVHTDHVRGAYVVNFTI